MWKQKLRKFAGILFVLLGAVCFFFSYIYQRMPHTYWGYLCAVGVLFAVLGVIHILSDERRLPRWLVRCAHILGFLVFASFVAVEGALVQFAAREDIQTPDAVIVLGCGLDGDQPSQTLADRLDSTLTLLTHLPDDVPVVVSGGQGADEAVSEAQAMETYLTERGVPQERILKEERATSTQENLRYSVTLLEDYGYPHQSVTLVTSGFHMCRASFLANRAGLQIVYCYSAPLADYLKPTYYLREYVAFVKSFLLDW